MIFAIVLVECVNHLDYLMETINEGTRLFAHEAQCLGDCVELLKGHVWLQPEGSTCLD